MSSVRKKITSIFKIIGKDEAIDALEIYAESKNITGGIIPMHELLENFPVVLRQHDLRVAEFDKIYGYSYKATIAELWKWQDYIFPKDGSSSSINEVYENYAKCVGDKEPTKWLLDTHQFGINEGEWVFKGHVYDVKGLYSDEQIKLLILEDFDKERRYFEKLKAKFDEAEIVETDYERPRIPEKVRIEVWRRDDGKCARCGSREKLEYDHIVPISKGGSNTTRNIELLCEKHNRSKSNNVV